MNVTVNYLDNTVVYIRRFIYKFLNVSFWLHGCCGEWESWARKPFNHTSWMTVVTPSDRPKSVRNRCVIEHFGDVFVLSCCLFDISDGIGAFVIGLSQISSFSLLNPKQFLCLNWSYSIEVLLDKRQKYVSQIRFLIAKLASRYREVL